MNNSTQIIFGKHPPTIVTTQVEHGQNIEIRNDLVAFLKLPNKGEMKAAITKLRKVAKVKPGEKLLSRQVITKQTVAVEVRMQTVVEVAR